MEMEENAEEGKSSTAEDDALILDKNKDEASQVSLQSSSVANDAECDKPAAPLANGPQHTDSNLQYEGNKCIYTDPTTNKKFEWNEDQKEWIPQIKDEPRVKYADVKAETGNNQYEFDGESYCYTDSSTGVMYKYNNSTKKWEIKENEKKNKDGSEASKEPTGESRKKPDMESGIFGYENDTHTYTDPSDGTAYIWDKEKNAWFPKVDEDFLARYQMNYGFTPSGEAAPTVSTALDKPPEENKQAEKRKGPPPEPSKARA